MFISVQLMRILLYKNDRSWSPDFWFKSVIIKAKSTVVIFSNTERKTYDGKIKTIQD